MKVDSQMEITQGLPEHEELQSPSVEGGCELLGRQSDMTGEQDP